MNFKLKTLLTYTFLVSSVECCPSSCICKWQNDKQTVECPWKNLENLPENIDSATQVLDLSGNNFQQDFDFKMFVNLQKLFLKNCQIASLKRDVFESLTNLVDLDLSENLLQKVPLQALVKCPSLMKLNLCKNPIKILEKLAFNRLNFLQNIDLSSCELTHISPQAFNNLYSLEWLDLSQNKLKNLPQISMPHSLKGVQLYGNQWLCDCKIKPLTSWLKIYPVLVAPICEEPRKFRGLPVRGLNDSELSCEPQIIEQFEVEEGQNATLNCDSEAEIYWQFKNKTISLNRDLVLSGMKVGDNGTYYCLAKDIVIGNFTVIVVPKPDGNARKMLQKVENSSISLESTFESCPPSCICKLENDNRQTVECPWTNPENIDSATHFLDLSGKNFYDYDFKKFTNLQKLVLQNCQIASLNSDAFEGLTNLADLDLSENSLEIVPLESLISCPSLKSLNLSKNPIKSLEKLAFNHLNFLQNIDLSSCQLTQIDPDAFNNLHSLEWLDLSQNKLENLPQIPMPQTLKGVQLHGNQWICDCNIKPLSSWLKIYPVSVPPICEEPRKFRGLAIRGLNDSELRCEPQIIEHFEVEEGQNATLNCESEAEIYWQFKNRTISLNQDLFLGGLKVEDNGTYYCLAKDVVIGNFTVIVIAKPGNATKLFPKVDNSSIYLESTVKPCPMSCICKLENDNSQTVECPLKNPENIDSATHILDLSGKNFYDYDFKKFTNLQKLVLRNCQIASLNSDAFEGLTNLVDLDLSENFLQEVPLEALIKCPSLKSLNLSKNPIKSLEKFAFNHLNFLQNIDLSSCQLTRIDPDAFNNLHSLEWLDLSQNKFKNLPQIPIMPQTLKGVHLHGNQWLCDCNIKPLISWLKMYPVSIPPMCEEPRKFRGLAIRGLNDSELWCEPQIEHFEVEEGQNATLNCESEAEIYWQFKNRTISSNPDLFLSRLQIEDNGTYYCLAKEVVIGNFTVIVLPKPKNAIKLLQDDEKSSIIPILLAAGLIITCLCLVALLMALIKRPSQNRSVKPEATRNIQPDFIVTSAILAFKPQIKRQRTHAYLNPTLKSNFRPVSAPSFERYVENYDSNGWVSR